jgi:hypothetical protein
MTAMRAKVRISHIDRQFAEQYGQETLYMHPVAKSSGYPEDGSDENNTYAKFSPSGAFQLTIQNPALLGKFAVDEEYYVDFSKVEKVEKA